HEPLGIIAHERPASSREIEELLELVADATNILFDDFERVERSLRPATARITDHPRTAANKRDRPIAGSLKMSQPHDRDQMANMEAPGSGIEPAIRGDRRGREHRMRAFGVLIKQPAPCELIEKGERSHPGKIA